MHTILTSSSAQAPDCSASKIRAIAAFGGLSIDVVESLTVGVDNRTPEYIAKFASGKLPAFEDKDGFTLFESAAISRYGKSKGLLSPHLCSGIAVGVELEYEKYTFSCPSCEICVEILKN